MDIRQIPVYGDSGYFDYVNGLIKKDRNITECPCRMIPRSLRECCVEQPLLEKIKRVFSEKKNLVLFSLGSGGCGQELAICKLLAENNCSVQKFILVDNAYKQLERDPRVVAFTNYFKMLFDENAQVSAYEWEGEYFEAALASNDRLPDVILCIDMDNLGLESRVIDWRKWLGDSTDPCILAYCNVNLEKTREVVHAIFDLTACSKSLIK